MPTRHKPSRRIPPRPGAAKPSPKSASVHDAGLAGVPPPLAFERTAAAAEDEGFDAATAAIFAAVVAVDVFCVAEANGPRPRRDLGALVKAAELAGNALEAWGAGEAEFTHLFAPRLPFDVLLADGTSTAADLFLARHADDLPKDAVRAVKALVGAVDTVARAKWEGKDVTIEDLATGRTLPGPARWKRGARPFACRLVRLGGVHVPVAVERPAGRVDVERLLAGVSSASAVGRDALKAEGIRLKSPRKGFGLGSRLLFAPGSTNEKARPTRSRRPPRAS